LTVASDDILEEVRELHDSLSRLLGAAAKDPPEEHEIWSLYARSERLAAVLKFRLGVERPGVFLKLPRSEKPEEFLPLALGGLGAATEALEKKKQLDGLESIRTARTYLRAYLAEKRRIRMRMKRKASAVRRSSSPS
jgi:hypothetical protein